MKTLISTEKAISLLKEHWQRPASISCILQKANGRILKQDLLSDRHAPPFDRVMMDGFAIRYSDWQAGIRKFSVSGFQPAGSPDSGFPDKQASAIEVMTGAVCPDGADCIVPVEYTSAVEDKILVEDSFPGEKGLFIHKEASDYKKDSLLVPAGKRMGPCEIAIAASCGYAELEVEQQARIAVFGSGDELVSVDESPEVYQIRQSNLWAIDAAIKLSGHRSKTLEHLPDDEALIESTLKGALELHEVLVLSGGISKGKKDYLPMVLERLGARCIFHGIAQRPGKPMGFWKGPKGQNILALPGNPVSTLTCLIRYFLPALDDVWESSIRLPLLEFIDTKKELTVFLPVKIQKCGSVKVLNISNSGDFIRLAESDGFIELEAGKSEFLRGESLKFYPWN